MNQIINPDGTLPSIPPDYRWKTHDGLYLRPHVMVTRHLFHTVVMLWHHFMPDDAKLYNHKQWRINRSPEYIALSIRVLLTELSSRDDMTDYQMRALKRMAEYLRRNPQCLTTNAEKQVTSSATQAKQLQGP